MPTYKWVAIGMLTAGIGGALASWGSMVWVYRGLEEQSPGVLANLCLAAFGGVVAALCGGVASIGRGQKADRKEMMGDRAAIGLGLGLGVFAVITHTIIPALLVLLILATGLAAMLLVALLGGLAALAALWTVLRLAGIRNESDLVMPFSGAVATPLTPLSKAGVIAFAFSFVLSLLPYIKDSPEGIALSGLLFLGGVLLCGASFLLRGASRLRERGSNVVEPSDAADSRASS